MNKSRVVVAAALFAALFTASTIALAEDVSVKLTGAEEVPGRDDRCIGVPARSASPRI